jgi:hypothetical protein
MILCSFISISSFLSLIDSFVIININHSWKFITSDNLLWSQLDLSPFARKLYDPALVSYLTRYGTHVQTLKLCQSKKLSTRVLTM